MLAAILIAVVVTVIICKWYFNRFVPTEKKAENNQKRFEELPCAKHEEEISSIVTCISKNIQPKLTETSFFLF